MSDNLPCASEITPLEASPACTLRANMSTTPPLTLLTIATSIEGILASPQPKSLINCPKRADPRNGAPRVRVAIALPLRNAGLAVPPSKLHDWVSPGGSVVFDFSRPMFLLAAKTPRVQPPNAAKCGRFNQTVGRSAVGSISDYSLVANERGDCGRQRIPGLLSGLNKANSESRSTGGSQSSSKDRIATRRARRKVGR